MKIIKLLIIFLFVISVNIYAQDRIPQLLRLNWGASFQDVENKIIQKDVGLTKLRHYEIFEGKGEAADLLTSPEIKYFSNGSPFFNIPADVIFTFYNPTNNKGKLKLTKIEVYMNKKDDDNVWVDSKTVYKNLIRIFFDNYDLNLKYNQERQIFSDYNYQVTVNGIFVTFTANVGENILERDKSVLILYESNKLVNMILKREKELSEVEIIKSDDEKELQDTKRNL